MPSDPAVEIEGYVRVFSLSPVTEISGLVREDEFGEIVPAAAWCWESDPTSRKWSFHIRADLYIRGTGARVTAHTFETLWGSVAELLPDGGLPEARCRALNAWKLVVVADRPDPLLAHRISRSALRLDIARPDRGRPDAITGDGATRCR